MNRPMNTARPPLARNRLASAGDVLGLDQTLGQLGQDAIAEVPTDLVADGVAGDRSRRADDDHGPQRKLVLVGEHPTEQDDQLAGKEQPDEDRRFGGRQGEDQDKCEAGRNAEQPVGKVAHGAVSATYRRAVWNAPVSGAAPDMAAVAPGQLIGAGSGVGARRRSREQRPAADGAVCASRARVGEERDEKE